MPEINITKFGNMLAIKPAYVDILRPALSFKKRVQEGPDPRNIKHVQVECYSLEKDGALFAPAGLLSRVCDRCRKSGLKVKFNDTTIVKLPEPDLSVIEPMRGWQENALASLLAHERGIVEAPTGSGKSWLLRQLCKVWPEAKIIICSASVDVVKGIYKEMLKIFPPNEIGMCGGGESTNARITCTTARSLVKCNLSQCDLLIYDEVHRSGAPDTLRALTHIKNARMYGFSASPKGRADNTDMEVECMFGPIIYTRTYQEVEAEGSIVPIEVYVTDTSDCPRLEYKLMTALERNCIWKSACRNSTVAEAIDWAYGKFGKDTQTLIFVKTVTHAVHLSKYLPDFQLVYSSMSAEDKKRWAARKLIYPDKHPLSPKKREKRREDVSAGKLRKVIATDVWSTGVDFPQLGLLVRADAKASTIANVQIPGRVSRTAKDKDCGIILDFSDGFNDTLSRRWLTRQRLYRGKGWKIHLTDL